MTALETPPRAAAAGAETVDRDVALIDLQFQVARRADALARRFRAAAPDGDRRLWLRAECEVFDRGGRSSAEPEV